MDKSNKKTYYVGIQSFKILFKYVHNDVWK